MKTLTSKLTLLSAVALFLTLGTASFAKADHAKSTRPHGTRQILSKIDKDLSNLIVLASCQTSDCGQEGMKDDECEGIGCILTIPKLLSRLTARTSEVTNRMQRRSATGGYSRMQNAQEIQQLVGQIGSEMKMMAQIQALCPNDNCGGITISDAELCTNSDCRMTITRPDLIKRIATRQARLHALLGQ